MKEIWESICIGARQAWREYWTPIHWLFSSEKDKKKFKVNNKDSNKDEDIPTYQKSIWWIASTTFTYALLASAFFYFFIVDFFAQISQVSKNEILITSLLVVWIAAILKIAFYLFIKKLK